MRRTLNHLSDAEKKAYRKLVRVVRHLLPPDTPSGGDAGRDAFRAAVGEALMVIRLHRDLSQVTLAGKLSQLTNTIVPQGYVSKIETGKKSLSAKRLAVFCRALDCTLDRVYSLASFLAGQQLRVEKDILREVIRRTGGQVSQAE